ncbi:MAG TPA: DUF1080 domain-containing protein, partial [Gemmataceae bacterium]|nr:DUF1080 domain-containing protein [Gemmataceae bacterium]
NDTKDESGFVPMFNGHDLAGWQNVNCAPSTFNVKDGEIITTGHPTGYLRTTRQYENFIAEFDWMHVPAKPGAVGNSGFFVWCDPIPAVGTGYTRGIEVQVLVNLTYRNKKGEITATSQGDLFSIHGATCVPDRPHPDGWARCLPSGNYCKGEREWNHYRVEGNDGRITLAVNGHVVSGVSKCNPRKGYLALESEGSECHFRNLKIKELPSTHPKPSEVADEDKGFKNLYTGLDLSGWKADDEAKKHWQPHGTVLHYDGKGEALRTEKAYGDAEFIVDFKFPAKANGGASACNFILRQGENRTAELRVTSDGHVGVVETASTPRGGTGQGTVSSETFKGLKPAGQWNRLQVQLAGKRVKATINGASAEAGALTLPAPLPSKGSLALQPEGEMDFANLFVRELK